MWFLWFCLLFHSVLPSQAEFGTPYLKNSRLCKKWDCVNSKLGLPLSLPPKEQFEKQLKTLLPASWSKAVDTTLDVCYNSRRKNYVNTCPGQALLHCTLDNLIENCPEDAWRKDDACYPISTIAGMNYMFSQSRYQNLEKNLPKEQRPAWFMKQYFNSKCCNIPPIVDSLMLTECGFRTFVKYYDHEPKENVTHNLYLSTKKPTFHHDHNSIDTATAENDNIDPLDCCDMKDFIAPTWRKECDFKLTWDVLERLSVKEQSLEPPTTISPEIPTETPVNMDIMVVPHTCDKETCVFKKLNVINDAGSVDVKAFSKLLDNLTDAHPSWMKAKARVITQCLKSNIINSGDCEINNVLRCVLDVLSENCPHRSKEDVCRHSNRNGTMCQISSSMYRPKNRRSVCGLPNFVDSKILNECGLKSISTNVYIAQQTVKKLKHTWHSKYLCEDSSPAMLCTMNKMGILNKYKFMDYFRMKDQIRKFTEKNIEWFSLGDIYMNTFASLPMYHEYCSSPKKLLNVIDAMLMTCPITKRKNTPQCTSLFKSMANTSPKPTNKRKLDQIMKHFSHVFLPVSALTKRVPLFKKYSHAVTYDVAKPIYDYGILHSKSVPEVKTIGLHTTSKPPIVLLPVYLRDRSFDHRQNLAVGQNGVFQSAPYLLHGRMSIPSSTKLP